MFLTVSSWSFPSPTQFWNWAAEADIRSAGADPAPAPQRGIILVVDDNQLVRELVANALEFEGYAVRQAINGAEALALIERLLPGLVLLDMHMPVLNGWEVAALLKERGSSVPIVVMTTAPDIKFWAQKIGAIGYLAKPFGMAELLDAVRQVVGPPPLP